MKDDSHDVFNIDTNKPSSNILDIYTDEAIDIHEISYLSDGKNLNATLWLNRFDKIPDVDFLSYIMAIDVDGQFKNGIADTDYDVVIYWDKDIGNWTRIFEEKTPSENIILDKIENYTGFYGIEDDYGYVKLSADLSKMVFPQNYDITFWSTYTQGNSQHTDVTNGVHIPPIESAISMQLVPNPVELRPGDEKIIRIQVNSTSATEPIIHLYISNESSDIKYKFANEELLIPSFGEAATTLKIDYSGNSTDKTYILPITADVTIPYVTAFPQFAESNNVNPSTKRAVHSMSTTEHVNLIVNTLQPEYNLSISPNHVELRPGDEKNLQLMIRSNTNLSSRVSLNSRQFVPLEVSFSPNESEIFPLGWATSILHVKAPTNSGIKPYLVPIIANFSIERADTSTRNKNIPHQHLQLDSIYQTRSKEYDLTINMLPPLSFGEQLSSVYSVYLSPISGIWTFIAGVAAVIAPVLIRRKRRSSRKKPSGTSKDRPQ